MVTAEQLAEALEDLLYSHPPRYARDYEEKAFEESQDRAKTLLEKWEAQNG